MRVLRSFSELEKPLAGSCVAVGVFDGVHRGHREILRRLRERSRASGGETVLCTFDPHPRAVIDTARSPRLLTLIEEKLRIFASLGIDRVIILRFDGELARLTAEEFVREGLVARVGLHCLVVGYDFRLGRGREGDCDVLRRLGRSFGFAVEVVPPILAGGRPVKSTWVRDELERGRVERAAELLNRFYSLRGTVERGEGRGRRIGFPTANLHVAEEGKLWPARGVYATLAEIEGHLRPGVTNVGVRPTFGGKVATVETHLLGSERDFLGAPMAVHFVARIRAERPFPSAGRLAEQIGRDRDRAEGVLRGVDERFVFTRF